MTKRDRWAMLATVALFGLVGGFLSSLVRGSAEAQAQDDKGIMKVRRLEVTDKDGAVRASIGVGDTNNVELTLSGDPKGNKQRVVIDSQSIWIQDTAGKRRVECGMFANADGWKPMITIYDAAGKEVWGAK